MSFSDNSLTNVNRAALNRKEPRRGRPVSNKEIERRLFCLRAAIELLNEMGLIVLEVDANRPMPVILIQVSPRNKELGPAYAYAFTGGAHGRVRRFQVQKHGCRIEWDVQGH